MTANESLPPSSSTPPTFSDLADLADVIMNVGQEIKLLGGGGKTIPSPSRKAMSCGMSIVTRARLRATWPPEPAFIAAI